MAFPAANFVELLKNPTTFAQWLDEVRRNSEYIPAANEADALAGEGGTPSSANPYVLKAWAPLAGSYGVPSATNVFCTDTDPRLAITVASMGTFTMDAADTKVIADTAVSASCGIMIQDIDETAGTLQAGASRLVVKDADFVVGVSFTVTTSDGGSAAGTEEFRYWIFD